MGNKKQLYIILADNSRQLLKQANDLELTKEDIVSILTPGFKGDSFKLVYYK